MIGGGGDLGCVRGGRTLTLIDKNAYLVTLALVSSTRKGWSRAQTLIFTISNQYFLIPPARPSVRPSVRPSARPSARPPAPGILFGVSRWGYIDIYKYSQ